MAVENLVVQKLILHEVFRRRDDKNIVQPTYGSQLIQLQADPMDVFVQRVTDAMGSDSQSMKMDIVDAAAGSAIEIAAGLVSANDAKFVTGSMLFADRLAAVQLSRGLPGGIVVVFCGTVGNPARKFVAVIKAETQSGFRLESARGVIGLRYLEKLFLTPATKLYKIGLFVQQDATQKHPAGWEALVYDSGMSATKRDGAARYFFGLFLGCEVPENSAFLTKSFFENTRDYIKAMTIPPEKKADLITSLYTYLKVDQTPTIEVNTFSSSYMPASDQAEYKAFMTKQKFPQTAVAKDIADLKGMLRQRKLVFPNNIRLTAPPEAFKDMIEIKRIPSGKDGVTGSSEWTQITIRDRIVEQE